MASKVPKFGAWEGGENFTVCFDNARKVKHNGPMINPNDPQQNPSMFAQNAAKAQASSAHNRTGSQAKVPQFGAWDNGETTGYTMYFDNARKTKNTGGPTVTEKEPQAKRDPQPQARPSKIKPEPQEARSKVPQFGGWESDGEVAYTMCFDNVRTNKNGSTNREKPSNEPEINRDVGSRNKPPPPPAPAPAPEARAKVPQFGGWNGGENIAYSVCFDDARKNKNGGIGTGTGTGIRPTSVEPQSNRDAIKTRHEPRGNREDGHLRNASRGSAASLAGSERQGRRTPGDQSPLHPRGGKSHLKHPSRGGQNQEKAATIPPFGVWNSDPKQAEGFTGTFERALVEKNTPLQKQIPPSYHQQPHQYKQEEKKQGCCFPWF